MTAGNSKLFKEFNLNSSEFLSIVLFFNSLGVQGSQKNLKKFKIIPSNSKNSKEFKELKRIQFEFKWIFFNSHWIILNSVNSLYSFELLRMFFLSLSNYFELF